MPAVNPNRLSANLRSSAPSRNLTPQEMRFAVAELKNKPNVKNLNPDDSPIGLRPNVSRPPGFVEEAPPQMPQMPQGAPPMTRQTSTPTMRRPVQPTSPGQMMKKGGQAKAYASGGKVRGGGCEQRGKTKGRMV